MEIMLAIVVVAAVIFFGALISMGNERQRKAIDNLREQLVLWATHDLRIKHEKLARDIHVDDPQGWLNKVAGRACGRSLNLQVVEFLESPSVLLCATGNGDEKIIFTPHSPADIRSMKRAGHNRLDQYADRNPLLSLPRNVDRFECSIFNNGVTFDLELPLAWKGLTGTNGDEMNILWMYLFS
jgi:hypothetical protein